MGKRKLCFFDSLFKPVYKEDPCIPHFVNTYLKVSFNLWISPFLSSIYWKTNKQTNKKTIISHILYFANRMYSEHISWKLELPRGLHRSRVYFTKRTSQCCLLSHPHPTPTTHTHENTQDSYGHFSEMSRWLRRTIHIEKSRIIVWIYPSIYYQNN